MGKLRERFPDLDERLSDVKEEALTFFSGRWGRWRLVVAAVWSAVSLASLGGAAFGGESNDLGAEVRVVPTGFGTAVDVHNQGQGIWRDVTVTLSGGYLYRKNTLRPGERLTLQVEQFERVVSGRKEKAPREMRPSVVRVSASEGAFEARLDRR